MTLPHLGHNVYVSDLDFNPIIDVVNDHETRLDAIEDNTAIQNDVITAEASTSTSYVDLATVGPSASVHLDAGQKALVTVSCEPFGTSTGPRQFMSFAISGQVTQAPSDTDAAKKRVVSVNDDSTVTRSTVFTATGAGTYVFTAKYKIDAGSGTSWQRRRIIVKPQ